MAKQSLRHFRHWQEINSHLFQVALLDHPFVRLARALDAVLLLAAVIWKRPDDLIFATRRFVE
jgi:hypothetical protein